MLLVNPAARLDVNHLARRQRHLEHIAESVGIGGYPWWNRLFPPLAKLRAVYPAIFATKHGIRLENFDHQPGSFRVLVVKVRVWLVVPKV
jgi:hypothetical protein